MHILVIPGAFPNEYNTFAGIFFSQMTDSMQDAGFNMGVVAPDIRPFAAFRDINSVREIGKKYSYKTKSGVPILRKISINMSPGFRFSSRNTFVSYSIELFNDYVEIYGVPKIILAHTSLWAGLAALKIKDKTGIPYIVYEHSSDILRQRLSKQDNGYVQKIMNGALNVIAVSNSLKLAIERLYGINAVIIPNLVNWIEIKESNKNKSSIVSIGNLIPVKGYTYLIDAFAKCKKEIPDLTLTIIGGGSELSSLQALCNQHGIIASVNFKGPLSPENTKLEISNHGIFVSSSLYETFGVAIVEALMTGMPVVATRSGGPEDIVNKLNGVLCESGDTEDLYKAILYVYNHYNDFDHSEIRKAAQNKFGEKAIIEKLKTIFHE